MPRKFNNTLAPRAKRNSLPLKVEVPISIRQYICYRANAENKTLSQVLISIITKEINNDKFYKK